MGYAEQTILPSAARTGAGVGNAFDAQSYANSALVVDVSAIDPGATLDVVLQQNSNKVSAKWADTAKIEGIVPGDLIAGVDSFQAAITEPLLTQYRARWVVTGGNATFTVRIVPLPSNT